MVSIIHGVYMYLMYIYYIFNLILHTISFILIIYIINIIYYTTIMATNYVNTMFNRKYDIIRRKYICRYVIILL